MIHVSLYTFFSFLYFRMRPVSMPISAGGGNNSGNRTEPLPAAENVRCKVSKFV